MKRKSTVKGKPVDDIILDTGYTRTIVRQDVFLPQVRSTERTIQIKCAHGDIYRYPLATIHLDVDGVQVEVMAAISQTLPVSVLLRTHVSQLVQLLHPVPQSEAFVVTRAQTKREADGVESNCQKDIDSKVQTTPVCDMPDPNPTTPDGLLYLNTLHDDLFQNRSTRKNLTQYEKRLVIGMAS